MATDSPKPATVASSAGNEWNPAIAADSTGRVSVAWDSYRNGNYDIYARTATSPASWGKEMPVAASATYEAYPSIAYDPAGTLWVAYEEGGERWGKDFGADESQRPLPLRRPRRPPARDRQGRQHRRAQRGPWRGSAGVAAAPHDETSRQTNAGDMAAPRSGRLEESRQQPGHASAAARNRAPRNTMPRLKVDSSGRLWLACRTPHPFFWAPIGTVWTEYVTSYSGGQWTPAQYLHHTDNLLDNRPALVSTNRGELVVINSSDGRRQYIPMSYMPGMATSSDKERPNDPYNNDLYMSRIALAPATACALRQAVAAVAAPGHGPAR